MMRHYVQQQKGFALLLTLVVVSVVLAIGLSLLDVTLKQLILSGTARDSEIAFQSAYAGRDCGVYWARESRNAFISSSAPGSAPTLGFCINASVGGNLTEPTPNLRLAEYEIDWASGDRCTEIDIWIFDAATPNAPVSFDVPDYGDISETCPAGRVCTLIFSRGYNRACGDILSNQTIQRELVTQF